MTDVADAIDRARRLLEEKCLDEAIEVLLQARERYPEDEDLAGEIAAAFLDRGLRSIAEGHLDSAGEDLMKASAFSPLRPEALVGLAGLARSKGDLDRARRFLEESLSIDPEFSAAREGLALLRLAQGDAVGAEADFLTVLKTAASPGVFVGLSEALEAQGRVEEAREALRRGVEIEPRSESLLLALARSSEPEIAIRLLSRLVDLNSRHFDAWFERARMACALQDPEEAGIALDRCLRLDEERTRVRLREEFNRPQSPMRSYADHPYLQILP